MNKTQEIANKIKEAKKIALFHHVKPDGDSVSSSYGLLLAIKNTFPDKEVLFVADYEMIKERFTYLDFNKEYFTLEIDNTFMTIVGDVTPPNKGNESRLEHYDQYKKGYYKIVFDHHQNEADNDTQDLYWRQSNYGASAMQGFEIAKAFGVKLNEEVAFFMMLGILTDTGMFQYTLADEKPVRMYSELLEYISNERMDKYFNESRKKTKLDIEAQSYLFSNIQYDGQVAYVIADKEAVDKYGDDVLHWKINSFGNIEGTRIWVEFLQVDNEQGKYHVHLRSNGPACNEVASSHNGGGHIRAAGCWAKDEEEIKEILMELNRQ